MVSTETQLHTQCTNLRYTRWFRVAVWIRVCFRLLWFATPSFIESLLRPMDSKLMLFYEMELQSLP